MKKVIDLDSLPYYDREQINLIYESGYHLLYDLVPLYHMITSLKKYTNSSKEAKLRLKWMDHHFKHENVSLTCHYFDISRKTFYKWYQRYDPNNLYTPESQSTTPIHKRHREITPQQEMRVV